MLKWYVKVQAYLSSEKGQGMVEYGLILALISIAALTVLSGVGDNIVARFTQVSDKLKVTP